MAKKLKKLNKRGPIPPSASPWRRLAASVTIQAVRDAQSKDIITALDAFSWLTEGDGPHFCSMLDVGQDADILTVISGVEYETT